QNAYAAAASAKIEPMYTSIRTSKYAIQKAFPESTPFWESHAALTTTPPIKDGVVRETNSLPIRTIDNPLKLDCGTPDKPKTTTRYRMTCTSRRQEETTPARKKGMKPN